MKTSNTRSSKVSWIRIIGVIGLGALAAGCDAVPINDEASEYGTLVTRSEFTEFMRGDNYLCYDIREDGRCSHAEISERFTRNGFRYWQFSLLNIENEDLVFARKAEVEWDGDRLCDRGPFAFEMEGVVSRQNRALLDRSDMERASAEETDALNQDVSSKDEGERTCYEYRRSKDDPALIFQLHYINGVLQPEKEVETVTVVDASKGYVDLYE